MATFFFLSLLCDAVITSVALGVTRKFVFTLWTTSGTASRDWESGALSSQTELRGEEGPMRCRQAAVNPDNSCYQLAGEKQPSCEPQTKARERIYEHTAICD